MAFAEPSVYIFSQVNILVMIPATYALVKVYQKRFYSHISDLRR